MCLCSRKTQQHMINTDSESGLQQRPRREHRQAPELILPIGVEIIVIKATHKLVIQLLVNWFNRRSDWCIKYEMT